MDFKRAGVILPESDSFSTGNAAALPLERLENPETPAKEIKLGHTVVEHESTV